MVSPESPHYPHPRWVLYPVEIRRILEIMSAKVFFHPGVVCDGVRNSHKHCTQTNQSTLARFIILRNIITARIENAGEQFVVSPEVNFTLLS